MSSPDRQVKASYPNDHHYRKTSQTSYSARRQDPYPDYEDYYPPPAAGFREIEESLEQQYRSTSKNTGVPFFENRPPRRAAITRLDYIEEEEDYYTNDDEEEEDLGSARGNFWVNPEGVDPADELPRRRQRRRPPQDNPAKRSKRTTFRSGAPSVPQPVNELYNRLFWYGIDPDASSSPADRTMFGGTKGKFNGLSYLKESDGVPRPPRRRRSGPRPKQTSSALDEDDDGGGYITDDWEFEPDFDGDSVDREDYDFKSRKIQERTQPATSLKEGQSVTPPYDPPGYRGNFRRNSSRQRPPRPSQQYWETSTVAKWFSAEEDEEEYVSDKRGRKRQKKKDGWSAFDIVDAFLGVNRDELKSQANDYEQRMGLGKVSPSRRRRRERPTPEVVKQPMKYESPDLIEQESSAFDDVIDITADRVEPPRINEEEGIPMIELSWEERALAIERVPPADVAAWGPTGALEYDARTKAVMDALEDTATAKERVENRKKRVAELREEMTILRIDSELQKKRLRESRLNSQAAVDQLRRMDLDMEDSARKLRRELIKLKNAKRDLVELEARHWAILGFYDPEQAGVSVEDALLELKETEPAVRRIFLKEDRDMLGEDDLSPSPASGDSGE